MLSHDKSEVRTGARKKVTWAIYIQLTTVGVGYFMYALNRTAFPIGLDSLGRSLSFSTVQVSTLATIFLLGQAAVDVPTGLLNVRVGKTPLMTIGLLGTGMASLLLAFATFNFGAAAIYRILFGVFEGMFNVCVYAFAGSILPRRRAFLNNFMGAFYAVGSFTGPFAMGLFVARSPSGWQNGLAVFGVVTIVVGGGLCFVFTRRWARRLAAQADESTRVKSDIRLADAFGEVVRNRRLWHAVSIHAINLIAFWEFVGIVPYVLIHYKGYDAGFVGTVFGVGVGVASLLVPILGWWADAIGRRWAIVVVALANALAAGILMHFSVNSAVLVLLGGVLGLGLNNLYYTGYTIAQDTVPHRHIPIATGVAGAVGYLVASATGPISGWITSSWGYRAAGDIELVVTEVVVAILALVLLSNRRPVDVDRDVDAAVAGAAVDD